MKLIIASLMTTLALIIATIALSTPVQASGVNNNPWNYNFVAANGSLIYTPPVGFCGQYFHCIPNFPMGRGYVIECRDGLYSKSGGIHGNCSHHGGDGQVLYAHESSVASSPVQPASRQPVTSGSSSMSSPSLPMTGSDPFAIPVH